MEEQNQIINSFLSEIKVKQKRTAVLFTAISLTSVIVGLSLLAYFTRQVKMKIAQVNDLEYRLHKTEEQLRATEEALREANNLRKYVVSVDFSTLKYYDTHNPPFGRFLSGILSDSGEIKWKLNGKSPEEGFDSPGYAAFALRRVRGVPSINLSDIGNINVRQQLLEKLPQKPPASSHQTGDLIFYEGGFTMFYFVQDEDSTSQRSDRKEFVIGMTPLGIIALKKDFASFKDQDIRRPFSPY